MLGLILKDDERKEMEYLLKREMDELLQDLQDNRIDYVIKQAMKERYHVLFTLYRRFASERECLKYIPNKIKLQ
ncbi:hypothetical protein [Pontibacillus litoralis]|uniref:Uncharacterized protein n=1 Tax=Pontibacillus litoralis JSM 072002 TaxID=1385512 RepID=A0A0A5FZW7_9BACI|nr:hypothetical protein [Pontibacillus litoralis]KGX84378.1 hypothetical protein N784_13660 [Pontibacillus litoralis JSM 072002]